MVMRLEPSGRVVEVVVATSTTPGRSVHDGGGWGGIGCHVSSKGGAFRGYKCLTTKHRNNLANECIAAVTDAIVWK